MDKIIYFDNAATTGKKPEKVIEAVCHCLKYVSANPGRSSHHLSIEAAEIIYEAREAIGTFFNYHKTENIILTKNATEALNLVIHGYLKSDGGEVLATSMEHNSVLRPLNSLAVGSRIKLKTASGDRNGVITPEDIRRGISDDTRLVAVTAASNVSGTVLDLEGIYRICCEKSVPLLVDGAQGAGALEIDLQNTPFDFFVLTGHKHLFGPQGTGALIVKNPEKLHSIMQGGTGSLSEKTIQPDFAPDKFEAGTLNTPGFAGLKAGIAFILETGFTKILNYEQEITGYLLKKLSEIDEVEIYASDAPRRVSIISFNVKGAAPSEVSHYLDSEWGICARPGLHCSPDAHKTLGSFPGGSVRFSLAYFNTAEEIDRAADALKTFIYNAKKT